MKLAWAAFERVPGLDRYQDLKRHADRSRSWASWREKALGLLRKSAARTRQGGGRGWGWPGNDHSTLVEIFLWERKPDAAWEEAMAGGCSQGLWLKLAAKREKEHPGDALEVYRKWIDPIVDRKHKDSYREAVKLLRKMRALYGRLGRETEFGPYLAEVRAAHGRKRNFMALLDAAGWA